MNSLTTFINLIKQTCDTEYFNQHLLLQTSPHPLTRWHQTHVHVEIDMSAMKWFHQCMLMRNSSQREKMSQELKILFPPLFNIKFTQHILCNYFMHSGLHCRCKSSCTHTHRQHEALILREGGWWRSQRPHCARWARMLLTVQSWGSEKAARRTCKQTQRGAHIQSAD